MFLQAYVITSRIPDFKKNHQLMPDNMIHFVKWQKEQKMFLMLNLN